MDTLNTCEINNEKVVAVVLDNAANNVGAVYDAFRKVKYVACFTHTLSLFCENYI